MVQTYQGNKTRRPYKPLHVRSLHGTSGACHKSSDFRREMEAHKALSRNGPPLSHLFFANDMLLFAEASKDQINVIMDCMNTLCVDLCQKNSLLKSSIPFSSGKEEAMAKKISRVSMIPIKSHFEKYLRVPSIKG